MAVLGYLDISTTHVERDTMNPPHPQFLVAEYDHGAFFYVPEQCDYEDVPPDLARVLELARKHGCYLVRIDSDGDTYAELEAYDW